MRWDGEIRWDPRLFEAQMRAYVEGPDPIFPDSDEHFGSLLRALRRLEPPPRDLRPLLGPRGPAEDVDGPLLKRDALALCLVDSLLWRYDEGGRKDLPLLEEAALAGVHFSFDPLYGQSHTRTGEEIADFFSETPPNGATAAAIGSVLEPLLAKWRGRVTEKSTSTLFGIVLRHLGSPGGERLLREWEGMREEERIDLLERLGRLEPPSPALLGAMVDRTLDPSLDVRESAFRALRRQGAPVGDLDGSAREEEIRRQIPALRRWISERKP